MTKHRVGIVYAATEWVEVEGAKDEDEAKEKAYEQSQASLCHHCSSHLDLEDPIDFVVEVVDE